VSYIDIPVLGRVNLPGSGPARVHLLVGPSFIIKVDETLEPAEDDEEDSFENFETALLVGAGVRVSRFRVDACYGWGLTNIINDEEGEAFTGKNRVLSILVGFEP
jgi:hypothetical protein